MRTSLSILAGTLLLVACVAQQGVGSGSGAVVQLHANMDGKACGFKSDSEHFASGPASQPRKYLTVSGSDCCESFGWKFVGWYDTDGPTRGGTGRAGVDGNGYAAVCVPSNWVTAHDSEHGKAKE